MTQAVRPMPEEMPVELWRGVRPSSSAGWKGSVASIFVAAKSAAEMVSLSSVRAFADRGLEGDRFFRESWNAIDRSDKAVSFIEDEVLDLAAEELGLESIDQLLKRGAGSTRVVLHDGALARVGGRAIAFNQASAHLFPQGLIAQRGLSSGGLAKVYGFDDLDGSRPDCWRYMDEVMDAGKPADATGYR